MTSLPPGHISRDAADDSQTAKLTHKWQLPLFVVFLMLVWSVLFSATYTQPFFWDDLHFIRSYSHSELLSTFHGPNDPDGIETEALRPIATLLFHLQGSLFGENMVLQRGFMATLMGGLLWVVGLLCREVGLSFRHVIIVLVLFASSRVFASLVLWITLGSVILAYIFMVLTALFYLRWLKRGSGYLLALMFGFAALAVFTREEAYTLPAALLLMWWLSSPHRKDYRRPIAAAMGVAAIVAVQYFLRTVFVPDAPQLTVRSLFWITTPFKSAWVPGGITAVGFVDNLLKFFWLSFLCSLAVLFIRFSDTQRLEKVLGICVLGLIFCTPAMVVARAFGIALPSLAFFTAISIAVVDLQRGFLSGRYGQGYWRPAVLCVCFIGLALGVAAGVRRSTYVAESLNENALGVVVRDGFLLFDAFAKPPTIPESRRQAMLAHLNALGIHSRDDVIRLSERENLESPMFAEKYAYQSF